MGTAKTFLPTDVVIDEAGVIYLVADGVPTVLKVTALQSPRACGKLSV